MSDYPVIRYVFAGRVWRGDAGGPLGSRVSPESLGPWARRGPVTGCPPSAPGTVRARRTVAETGR